MDFRSFIVAPRLRYLYEMLQLELDATPAQVAQAYRRLVRQYHPDKLGGTTKTIQIFHDIQEAYKTLTNPAKIRELNEDYYASLPTQLFVGGRFFDIGAFFGMRFFRRTEGRYHRAGRRVKALLTTAAPRASDPYCQFFDDAWFEGETSILDHPDWDILEIMMAGTMDERQLAIVGDLYRRRGLEGATDTPWFYQNMEGFYYFSRHRFREAMERFDELNVAIPNNIIFMYRLGLCCEAFYYQAKEEGWDIYVRNDRLLRKAAALYERAVMIGRRRPRDERQHCFTIQKALADLYETVGDHAKARAIWVRILKNKRRSIEAKEKLKELSVLRRFLGRRRKKNAPRLLAVSGAERSD